MTRRWEEGRGRAAIAVSLLPWAMSVPALALAMRANAAADAAGRWPGTPDAAVAMHSHAEAAGWGLAFVALQLVSLCLLTFVLRARFRLRTAMCFAIGAGVPALLDALGLLALLVWLRVTVGA